MAELDAGVNTEEFDDGCYSYRKYGAKGPTQTRYSTRHYFKCNHEGCHAKKVVEIAPGQPPKVELTGQHNHPPDANKTTKRKQKELPEDGGDGHVMAGMNVASMKRPAPPSRPEETKSKRASAKGVRDVVQMVIKGHSHLDDDASPPPMAKKPSLKSPFVPPPRLGRSDLDPPTLAGPARLEQNGFADGRGLGKLMPDPHHRQALHQSPPDEKYEPQFYDDPFAVQPRPDPPTARAAPSGEGPPTYRGRAIVGHDGVPFDDSRIQITDYAPNTGQLSLLFDGQEHAYKDEYAWRKYGKKEIKGCSSNCPRYYWRCTNRQCDIKRHTQATNSGFTEVKYYGSHNHAPPPAKAGGRRNARPAAPAPVPLDPGEGWEDNNGARGHAWRGSVDLQTRNAPAACAPSTHQPMYSDFSEAVSPAHSQRSRASEAGLTDTSSIATSSMKRSPGNAIGDESRAQQAGLGLGYHQNGLLYPDAPRYGRPNERCPLFFLACVAANEPLPTKPR